MIKNITASLALALLVVGFASAETKTQPSAAKHVTKSAKAVTTAKPVKSAKVTKAACTKDCDPNCTLPGYPMCNNCGDK